MTQLIITLMVGVIGGTVALRLKIPAGAMVGSMVLVTVYSVVTGNAYLPQNVKIFTQIAAGAFIGAGITRKDVLGLKLLIKPAVLMVSAMIILNLLMGYLMYRMTNIDLATCLFATAPGGVVDMSIISHDLGADSSKVAVLQLVRLISVMVIFPSMMKHIHARLGGGEDKVCNEEAAASISSQEPARKSDKASKIKKLSKEDYINLVITLSLALITGLIGYISKVPAGAMTFAMVAVGVLNVFSDRGFMPLNIRRLTQMFAGALIGERVTYADVLSLKVVFIPALILLIGMIIINLCLGILISKASKLELVTSLLASAPGGLSDMAIIAKDLGGDAPKVAILQLSRYVSVIALFPILIKLLCS